MSAYAYRVAREEERTPSPQSDSTDSYPRAQRNISANDSRLWPVSPTKSASSSQPYVDATPFAPRRAVSDSGPRNSAHSPSEPRPVPSHDEGKIRLPSGQTAALTVVQVSDLHWFTSDRDLIAAATSANVQVKAEDITFLDHKCNGKSKGTAFINCHSAENMMRLLKWFETHEFQGKKVTPAMSANVNGRPPIPPPTHNKDSAGHTAFPGRDAHSRAPLPFPPTNAHGGVNFNRVPLHHRQQVQQMQQAGFLNHSNAPPKTTRTTAPVSYSATQAYGDMARKKFVAPVIHTPYDPAIVWQQTTAEYARLANARSLRI